MHRTKRIILFFLLLWINPILYAQDTFSIVALDSVSREVGSAGASCVDLFQFGIGDYGFLGELIPDTGAINTQASYMVQNQLNATARMRLGESPAQIISWLSNNDYNSTPEVRQYGIVGFNGNNASAAAYTGVNCMDYKNHITGNINGYYYSIQGNILSGQPVLDSMEARFRRNNGNLACRLMAALQGANVPGADSRCLSNGTSSLFAFLKVMQPDDTYGNPSLFLGVATPGNAQIEPIDSLQQLLNTQINCNALGWKKKENKRVLISPNPAEDLLVIKVLNHLPLQSWPEFRLFDVFGKEILRSTIDLNNTEVLLPEMASGIYFYQIYFPDGSQSQGKLQIR